MTHVQSTRQVSAIIGGGPTIVTIDPSAIAYQDQVSQDESPEDGYTFCGARVFTLVNPDSYMSISAYDITIEAADPTTLLGTTYTNILRMSLALYPSVPYIDIPVTVTLTNPCQSTTFNAAVTNPILMTHIIGAATT